MIKIDSITIKEFRGIRDLTLDIHGKNFAVCGPNGTGKSGVVDALEFALTGNVFRLSGEGKGEISLKHHGPHVDFRNNPDKARVILKLTIASLGKTVTIERSAKNPGLLHVKPEDPEVVVILNQVAEHPEIALSRRELIRYVLATPGDRAHEVQALLHLDRVEQVRVVLQKIANSSEKQIQPLNNAARIATENLTRALGTSELNTENLLLVANTQRALLGLPSLTELTASTSLKDGLAAPVAAKPQSIPKAQALADIQAARDTLAEICGVDAVRIITEVSAAITALAAEPANATGVAAENFFTSGLALVENESCPFCDTQWNLEALRVHVQAKIDHLKEFSQRRKAIETELAPLVAMLARVQSSTETLVRYGALSKPPITMQAASEYANGCNVAIQRLTALLPLNQTLATLSELAAIPQGTLDETIELEKSVISLPDSSKQDAARELLTEAQVRLDVLRDAKRDLKAASGRAEHARKISDIYAATSDKLLVGLYVEVQKDFAALYSFINRKDEEAFSAKLVPSMGKLGFDVDFYGRGFFPPGAYHSEGHQDGMGLCLYLALMRHLQGAEFTLAVLDDVLMSVDTGHRREVCELLKKEFPNTQFIITTHDRAWQRHMKTIGLVGGKSGVEFQNWTVDHGPTQWQNRDVWTDVEEHLQKNDVRAAAALLRHFFEYIATELCHNLRAAVPFRADSHYQLGELLPTAAARLRKLYGIAKGIADARKQTDVAANLVAREGDFMKSVAASNVEQWQVNVAVHYNSWDDLTKEDFEPVVKAYRDLLAGFACADCGYLYVSPDRETAELLRCDCGKINLSIHK